MYRAGKACTYIQPLHSFPFQLSPANRKLHIPYMPHCTNVHTHTYLPGSTCTNHHQVDLGRLCPKKAKCDLHVKNWESSAMLHYKWYMSLLCLNMIKCTYPLSIASTSNTALVADYKSNACNKRTWLESWIGKVNNKHKKQKTLSWSDCVDCWVSACKDTVPTPALSIVQAEGLC